ncbi:MAG: hypothetical protein EBQ58_15135 [Betaproteobacteria bacterium]|nr:hypothetical protein [Betaproteobacteria bacterium]
MGDLPTELLARDALAPEIKATVPKDQYPAGPHSLNEALATYQTLFEQYLDGETAVARAPLPDDLSIRSKNLKASAYFLMQRWRGFAPLSPLIFLKTRLNTPMP